MYDVIVIGAGSVGCGTARELSRYRLNVLVLEKGHDICSGASKCNSGMIHAGYDPIPGTNEARFNAPGCRMLYKTLDELEVPYLKNGTTIFAVDESGMQEVRKLKGFAELNGVRAEIVTPPELSKLIPDIGKDVKGVLWVPDGGVTSPFAVTFALAENAFKNGVEFRRETGVTDIQRVRNEGQEDCPGEDFYRVYVGDECFETRMVVNCAGVYSDVINNMVSSHRFRIIPRYGLHLVLDRKLASNVNTTLMETPHDLPGGGHTKGQAVITTVGGTLLLGCDAVEVEDPDFTDARRESIEATLDFFRNCWKDMPTGSAGQPFPEDAIISVFGGCRPHADTNDFVIGEPEDAPGFVNAGGIESPGFTSCIAIAKHVAGICVDRLKAEPDPDFDPHRKGRKAFREMTNDERRQAIASDPDYAKIVCRCEMVTEADIRDAIRRPLGARTVSEVKLRTRAGMGRCQGGFCSPRVVEILSEELGISPLEVTQCGGASRVLAGRACGGLLDEGTCEGQTDAKGTADVAGQTAGSGVKEVTV